MKRMLAYATLTLVVLGLVDYSANARGFRLFKRSQSSCPPCYVEYHYNPCSCQTVYSGNVIISQGGPVITGSTYPPPVATKFTSGAEIKRILYGPDLKPGKDPVNLSGLQKGDIVLEVDGMKVTSNKILIDAKEAASKAGKKMALKVWDPATKAAFTVSLDLAAPNQLVLEFDVIPVEVTVNQFKSSRP
jgi:hypothetical protein